MEAEGEAEFVGTVWSVGRLTGTFGVKKNEGGSRVIFFANENTHFDGGAKGVRDLKKDDHVAVRSLEQGPQYMALTVANAK